MKKFLCLILAVVIVLPFTACGKGSGGNAEAFSPTLDKETAGEIKIVGHYGNFEALEEEFNRFNVYYPNIELSYTCLDNYNRIITTTLAGNSAPDIYFTFPWWMNTESYDVLFENAEDLSDPSLGIGLSCIRDGLLNSDSYGKISIVPIYVNTYGMMVNESIFETERLSIPKTYDELVEVCGTLKEKYENPVMGYNTNTSLLYSLFFPHFCGNISGNATAIEELNALESSAGEYMRSSLELVADFVSRGFIDFDNCNQLQNDYDAVIKRFFEGDIPMMFASGSTVSGTEKRERQSEAFTSNPFKYSFYPVPSTENGGYFLNTISMGFTVNGNSRNLAITNEFMRFLVRTSELNLMAQSKRLVSPCKDIKLDKIYRSFGEVSADRTIYSYVLGLEDAPDVQVRRAGIQVTNGTMTVDEAVAAFGTL